jgi:hypothetical protein
MGHPPLVVLIAAFLAAFIAVRSIQKQRETTRLRETFASRYTSNWDKDVIEARKIFARLKDEHKANPQGLATFGYKPSDTASPDEKSKMESTAGILRTILNDYENLALGVRMDILDENYLFRLMRSTLISDWHTLSPLVTAYRNRANNNVIYIEFEGLTSAWQDDRSYRTKRKMYRTTRRAFFK